LLSYEEVDARGNDEILPGAGVMLSFE
jgi:hypothetical protein